MPAATPPTRARNLRLCASEEILHRQNTGLKLVFVQLDPQAVPA
jgi:hypothetical protein